MEIRTDSMERRIWFSPPLFLEVSQARLIKATASALQWLCESRAPGRPAQRWRKEKVSPANSLALSW